MSILSRSTPHKSAEKFRADRYPHLICFDGEWLSWNGMAYILVEVAAMKAHVAEFLIESQQSFVSKDGDNIVAPFNPKPADIAAVYEMLQHACHVTAARPPAWLDGREGPDPRNIISCRNGLLDVTTGDLIEQTPQFFTRTALPIDYSPDAPKPERWTQFLCEVTGNRSALVGLLQEIVGYLISNDTRQHAVFFPIGPPRTGKGTFLRAITALIGQDNIHTPTIHTLASSFGLHSLVGKSVAIIGDATCHNKQELSAAANRINGISGEDAQSVQRKFLSEITVRLPTRIIVASNHLPDFGEHSTAIGTRLIFLPFDVQFIGREDRGLEAKLLAELPGILNWGLEGLRRLSRRGRFAPPPECREIKTRMLHLSDPVRGFIAEKCTGGPAQRVEKLDLYREYVGYCEVVGVRPLGLEALAAKLREIEPGVRPSKAPRDSAGKRSPIFLGIALNDVLEARDARLMADLGLEVPAAPAAPEIGETVH